MEFDARTLSTDEEVDTDVCVVGCGPAALSVIGDIAARGTDVVALESGGVESEAHAQRLNAGRVEGDRYAGLVETRHRQFGGAANLWNTPIDGRPCGKLVPLDPHDFDGRGDPARRWPVTAADLDPYYRAAQRFCGIGPFAYDAAAWRDELAVAPLALGAGLSNHVYQVAANAPFTTGARRGTAASPRIRMYHHATALRLEAGHGGRRVVAVRAATGGQRAIRVRARIFVLAAGAVENARLLLLSGDALKLSGRDWVGRGFMEHPRDLALTLMPRAPGFLRSAAFYDLNESRGGTWIAGRLAIDREALDAGRLPNASVTLLPRLREHHLLGRARQVAERTLLGKSPPLGYGWSRAEDPDRWYDGFQVLLNVEQQPHAENRIALGDDRDTLGTPLPVLRWRWRAEDQSGLERLRLTLARLLDTLGRVTVQQTVAVDPNAHHHAGTTRMHSDPAQGVVDGDGLAHGTDNLYLAGASTFPTCGWANPTLTIVALGLRLAAHLNRRT